MRSYREYIGPDIIVEEPEVQPVLEVADEPFPVSATLEGNSDTPVSSRLVLLPYGPQHLKAQALMAGVLDPEREDGKPIQKKRVAELCGVERETLYRWIHDEKRGGVRAWYDAVHKLVLESLRDDFPLLTRVQRDEALKGKAKVGAFRNIAKLIGAFGPDVEIVDNSKTEVHTHAQVVVQLPDNGRSKVSNPEGLGFRTFGLGEKPGNGDS